MKQIKPGEYKKLCGFCSLPPRKARWRANKTQGPLYACDVHREKIIDAERRAQQDSCHFSKADRQTWMRLCKNDS